VRPALAALVVIACSGTGEPARDNPGEPVAKPVEPEPDCPSLVGAVERITANEIAELFRTRAIEVARIAAGDLERVAPTLREAMPRLCESDGWSGTYTACMATAKLRADAQACQVHLTQGQLDKLAADVRSRVPASPYGDLPSECQEVIAAMRHLLQCPQMQQMGSALAQNMDQQIAQMVSGFKDMAKTPGGAQTLVESCRVARDSIKSSFTALNCPPPP
jgi:hypothetical protein